MQEALLFCGIFFANENVSRGFMLLTQFAGVIVYCLHRVYCFMLVPLSLLFGVSAFRISQTHFILRCMYVYVTGNCLFIEYISGFF